MFDLYRLNHRELMILYGKATERLREMGIVRSSNNVIADYAEFLAIKALDVTLPRQSTPGYDCTDTQLRRYEIKARRRTFSSKPTHFSTLRRLDQQLFDFLVGVLFDAEFGIIQAGILPHSAVMRIARLKPYVNGHYVYLRNFWAAPELRDVTDQFRSAVQLALGNPE
jgi:hypothetical protein